MKNRRDDIFVYSSEHGELCARCEQPKARCTCQNASAGFPADGVVRVARETKGRKGAGVTLVRGVPLAGKQLSALAKELKQRCGTGGTIKDGVIEIQGDHRDAILAALEGRGWVVKRAGG